MLRRALTVSVLLLVFVACHDHGLNIELRYDEIEGLDEGDRVFFEENHMGNVTSTFYMPDGHYMVGVAIKSNFSNATTEHSRFFIIDDPHEDGRKAVEMIQLKKGGLLLQDGAVIVGSTRSSAAFAQMEEGLHRGLEDLETGLEQFIDSLSSAAESDKFKALEKELQRLVEEIARSGKSARDKIEKELLPRLREELDKLRERLRKLGREEEVKPLEIQMKRMMEI
jgi:paraquat-inducible protein B